MPGFYDYYDVAVVGAGHAGIEAALAAARMGLKTVLITQTPDTIGRLSCNPSIGGIAKGNIVREIDALGGEMAKLIDRSMIDTVLSGEIAEEIVRTLVSSIGLVLAIPATTAVAALLCRTTPVDDVAEPAPRRARHRARSPYPGAGR